MGRIFLPIFVSKFLFAWGIELIYTFISSGVYMKYISFKRSFFKYKSGRIDFDSNILMMHIALSLTFISVVMFSIGEYKLGYTIYGQVVGLIVCIIIGHADYLIHLSIFGKMKYIYYIMWSSIVGCKIKILGSNFNFTDVKVDDNDLKHIINNMEQMISWSRKKCIPGTWYFSYLGVFEFMFNNDAMIFKLTFSNEIIEMQEITRRSLK